MFASLLSDKVPERYSDLDYQRLRGSLKLLIQEDQLNADNVVYMMATMCGFNRAESEYSDSHFSVVWAAVQSRLTSTAIRLLDNLWVRAHGAGKCPRSAFPSKRPSTVPFEEFNIRITIDEDDEEHDDSHDHEEEYEDDCREEEEEVINCDY